MLSETIKSRLEERFLAPLPEFHKRRIVFWHDEDGEFSNQWLVVSDELKAHFSEHYPPITIHCVALTDKGLLLMRALAGKLYNAILGGTY
jgi:hypothetical protein